MKDNLGVPVVSIHDLLGLYTFLKCHDHKFAELRIYGDRVFGACPADDEYNNLSERFNRNEPVPVLDFLRIQRQIRGEMLALKAASQRRS